MSQWARGDQSAADALYLRYAQRLCALAESRLSERLRRRVGGDDVVQSVFRTFFRRANEGQFSVVHSGALWHLLVQITLNKVCKQAEHHQAGKRDVAAEIHSDNWSLRLTSAEPSAEEATALADELDSLLSQLKDPEPQIVQLCLEGHSTSEIANQLHCARWTVRRTLDRVGRLLERRFSSPS